MDIKNLETLTDDELLLEKKKLKSSKIFHAAWIGFLFGIFAVGMTAWFMNPNRKIGFLIPMLIPVFFIYKAFKNRNANSELEEVLKKRNLH